MGNTTVLTLVLVSVPLVVRADAGETARLLGLDRKTMHLPVSSPSLAVHSPQLM